jgi:hypothetical protein
MALTPSDIFKPEVLTDLVEEEANEEVTYDLNDWAPIVPVTKRRVELNVRQGAPVGIGQFRADNALTPLFAPATRLQKLEIELPLLSEKQVIREDKLDLLNSPDTRVAREVANELIDDGVQLRERNINLTRFMLWMAAATGVVPIVYPSGAEITIDYDLTNTIDPTMSASHLVDVSATPWSNPAANIIGHVRAWKKLISDDSGKQAAEMRVSSQVWEWMQDNEGIQKRVGTVAAPVTPDDPAQVAKVLGLQKLTVYDELYKDRADVTQRFLADNRVVLTTAFNRRQPALRVFDGPVARYNPSTQRVNVARNPGAVAEIWASADPVQEFVRVTTARVPMILREEIVSARVA